MVKNDLLGELAIFDKYSPIGIRLGINELDIDYGKPPKDSIPVLSFKIKLTSESPVFIKTQDYLDAKDIFEYSIKLMERLKELSEKDSNMKKVLEVIAGHGRDIQIGDDITEKLDVSKIVEANGLLLYKIKHPVTKQDTGVELRDIEFIKEAEIETEENQSSPEE